MKAIKRNLAILLAACMVITSVVPAFAEEIPEQQTETVNEIVPEEATPNEATYGSEAADPENEDIEKASPSDAKKSDSEVFIREATVDGVIVKVEAPAGTFPADAKLSVTAVDEDTVDENIENVEEKIDEAVEDARKKDKDLKDAKVLSSLKFDIKIVLPDGTELQPEGNKVKVTFTLAEKVGDCVDINVYHLKEVENTGNAADTEESDVSLKAEKVEGTVKTVPAEKTAETAEDTTAVKTVSEEVDEEGVLADGPITNDVNDEVSEFEGETDGFSYYTVEFTYEELQYVLPGDRSIALSDILAQLKIEGTVADVAVSNSELFSADKDANGIWTVTAHQAFSSTEKMTVTMDDGKKYEIVVTDNQETHTAHDDIENPWGDGDGETTSLPTNAGSYYLTKDITLSASWNVPAGTTNLCLNGHVIKLDNGKNGSVIKVGGGNTLNLYDCDNTTKHYFEKNPGSGLWTIVADPTEHLVIGGVITGGNANGGGVYVVNSGGTFNMKGGSIAGNTTTNNGGGVFVDGADVPGIFTMTGGSIIGNTASEGGGGVYIKNKGKFSMTGGNITSNTAKNGGGIYENYATIEMTGGSVDDNTATSNGGGVYIGIANNEYPGTFIMTGGNITDNKVNSDNGQGGGVCNYGIFTMEDGSISDNKANGSNTSGGGVYNVGTFTMENGSITGNNAYKGGGVYNNGNLQFDFKMTGGSITNNTATENGGGVNINGTDGSMTVGGNAKITGNKSGASHINNLYKPSNNMSILFDNPGLEMIIGVTLNGGTGIIATNTTPSYAEYFFADQSEKTVIGENTEIKIIGHTHTTPLTHTFEQLPTYDASGYKEHWKCEDCKRFFEDANGTILIDDIDMWKAEGGRGYIDKLKYSITFDTKGGSPIPEIQNVYKNGKVSEPEIKPTKDGYEFSCWCTDETATIPYDFDTEVTSNITLYAKWKATPTIKVSSDKDKYEPGEKIVITVTTTGVQDGIIVPVSDGTKNWNVWIKNNQATFIDASKTEAGTYTYTANISLSDISDSVTIKVEKPVSKKIVTFIYRNGKENTTTEVLYNEKVSKPSDPKMEGYTFDAWCSDAECKIEYDFGTPVIDNLPLYARWRKDAGTEGNVRTENKVVEIIVQTEKPEEKELLKDLEKNKSGSVESANSLADAVKNKVKEEATKNGKDVILFIDTQLTGIKVEKGKTGETEKATTTLTYDATPWMSTIGSDGKVEETRKIDNNDLNGNITLRLPVPASITEKYVNIVHESDGYPKKTYKNLEIVNQGTDKAYVEIKISHFSSFELTFSNEKSIDPVPYNGNSGSGSTSELFTGRPGNPVTNGTWNYYPAIDKWTYTTSRKFTNTWAYIANPYAGNEAAWFYFDEYGYMLTGWHKLYWNGAYRWFYFIETKDANEGKCQLGGITPDGHKLGADGAWIEK